jgi:TonB-like protein
LTSEEQKSLAAVLAANGAADIGTAVSKPPKPIAPMLPGFLVTRDPASEGWRSSIKALLARAPQKSSRPVPVSFVHAGEASRAGMPGGSLGISFLVHCSFIVLLVWMHNAFPMDAYALQRPQRPETIYYRVPLLDTAKQFPRLAPKGPGAPRPGTGVIPEKLPALGSDAKYGNLTVVSKPVHPDNNHQTIIQPNSPPDLRINTDLQLPNIVVGKPTAPPKSALHFDPNDSHPTMANRQVSADPAPNVNEPMPQSPITTFMQPVNPDPRMPIPSGAMAAPVRSTAKGGAVSPGEPGQGSPGDANGLLAISVDPSATTAQYALPPGNRWGEFSISPAGGKPGSPGGSPNGVVGGGSGGKGSGGDGSTGLGTGGSGGGGGNSGPAGGISINGTGNGGGAGNLGPGSFSNSMVFPVATAPVQIRKNALIIASGSTGGGGLDVYGALRCGKIYSIILNVPGGNWAMQYCEKSEAKRAEASETGSMVIHLQQGLVPPDADMESRFDFKRLPVPPEKLHKKIVLKGTLREDGTIDNLQVYLSILPQMDEAAKTAFSKWKFKPAMRDGKPVPVEILVGIPVETSAPPK